MGVDEVEDKPPEGGEPAVPEAVDQPVLAKGTERFGRLRKTTEESVTTFVRPSIVVLAITGDQEHYASVLDWIQRRGIVVELATTGAEGLRIHHEKGADLVLLGLPLPDGHAAKWIAALRERDPRATIVVVGKDDDVASHIAAVELGAQEYIADPVAARRDLLFALGVMLGVRKSDAQFRVLRAREAAAGEWRRIVANCPAMLDVMRRLRELCEWTLSGATPAVLITGPRGTGKRTLARALHYNGARRNRAFVEVNCAALSPEALRVELFGEIHGAARQGLLEIADGGTVFLDEIDAVPLGIQRELLTAMEGRQISRVGSTDPIIIDAQFVASTRADLAEIVKRSELRADLYHRLSVRTIALPPLRERGGDIIQIAEALLAELAVAQNARVPQLHDDAALALLDHTWPGNIHELRNELEHVLLQGASDVIRAEHFRFRRSTTAISVDQLEVRIAGDQVPLDRLERDVIRQALARNGGNISRTARFLAITRQTLLYRLKKHGLRGSED